MKHQICRMTYILEALFAGVLILQTGCKGEQEQDFTPLLAEGGVTETKFASFSPKHPYQETASNLLVRTVFEATGPDGIQIAIQDLFILPGKTAEHVPLPKATILEVLSGEGKMIIGDKSQEIKTGTIFSVAQGTSLSLESRNTEPLQPLVLRVRTFATVVSP